MSNPNFDAILSTTLKNYVPKFEDNVFAARVLFFFLKQANQIRLISGGAKIVVPLMYASNSTAGSYAAYDTLAVTPSTDGLSAAEYNWAQFAVTIRINGLEEAQNSGEAEIIDLLDARVAQAEESAAASLNVMFYGNGSGNAGKDFLGLSALVNDNTGSVTTIGGIDSTANSYWRSYVQSTAQQLTIPIMTTAYNSVSVGNDQPNLILTTQTLFERYEGLLQPQLRYQDTKTADGGFQNLMFKGAPVTYDADCTATNMYFLNTRYLRLVGHKDNWFRATDFVRPNNQDARFAQILAYGNMTVSNRKRQGVLTGKTA